MQKGHKQITPIDINGNLVGLAKGYIGKNSKKQNTSFRLRINERKISLEVKFSHFNIPFYFFATLLLIKIL